MGASEHCVSPSSDKQGINSSTACRASVQNSRGCHGHLRRRPELTRSDDHMKSRHFPSRGVFYPDRMRKNSSFDTKTSRVEALELTAACAVTEEAKLLQLTLFAGSPAPAGPGRPAVAHPCKLFCGSDLGFLLPP